MGTVVTVDIWTRPRIAAAELAGLRGRMARAVALLHEADEVFSTWRADSPVSRIKRGEMAVEDAPAEVAEVVAGCRQAREDTGGWFDPWAMPGGFDPTGYVKGWAAQRSLAALVSDCVAGAIVNAAGDIAVAGGLPSGEHFRIGIADPAAPRRIAAVAEVTAGIATSGGYERAGHLIDPRTGRPAAAAGSATVTGPDLGLADALATALAVAGPDGLRFIEPLTGYAGLVIGVDGSRHCTPHFPQV